MTTRSVEVSFPDFSPRSRAEWRGWLAEHHATSRGVAVIVLKKNRPGPGVTYDEAVEEAPCFGRIESKTNAPDQSQFRQIISPRKPRSIWAKSNRERVARLIEQGLIASSRFAAIEIAKDKGSRAAIDAGEALSVPEDLASMLAASPAAERDGSAFRQSVRKSIVYWIESAKGGETRTKRIARRQ
jgi:uncharacterized protein YdeI (YjbR/CyaY-like superfamily)